MLSLTLRANLKSPLLPAIAALSSACAIGFGFLTKKLADEMKQRDANTGDVLVAAMFLGDAILFMGMWSFLVFMGFDIEKEFGTLKKTYLLPGFWTNFSNNALAWPRVSYALICAFAVGFCLLTIEIDAEYKRRSHDDATNNTEHTKKHTDAETGAMIFGDVCFGVLGITLLMALYTGGIETYAK